MLILRFGQMYHQAIEILGHCELTAHAAVVLRIDRELDQFLLDSLGWTDLVGPGFVDIAVAGRTTAGATTFGDDAFKHVIEGSLHDRISNFNLNLVFGAVVFNVGNESQSVFSSEG